jgi:ribonuclease HI
MTCVSEGLLQNPAIVHTDGGCSRHLGNTGAWAFTIQWPDGTLDERFGHEIDTTNNRMEMTAVLRALEAIEPGIPITLFSDSQYVIRGITGWSHGWVRNGWKTSTGGAVLNRDLWEQLIALAGRHSAVFEWVRGHSGIEHNERCDQLCTQAIAAAYQQTKGGAAAPADTNCGHGGAPDPYAGR